MVFRASHWLAPGSVLAMKVMVVGFDLLAYAFLILTLAALHEAPTKSILYAWNPLVIKVFAGSSHIDAIAVAALAAVCYLLVRRKRAAASVSLGLAIAAKVFPVILLPFLARRVGAWRTLLAGATALACCIPYLGAGMHLFDGLRVFSATWQFNAGPFQLLTWAIGIFTSQPQLFARITSAVLIAATLAMLYRFDDRGPNTFARYAVLALGAVLIFGRVVMPWYATWLLPLGIIAWNRAAIFFSVAVCTAFLVMVRGVEWPWALLVEYAALAAMMWWESSRTRTRALAAS
jgi:alpha-1,6-mannosyltransferase